MKDKKLDVSFTYRFSNPAMFTEIYRKKQARDAVRSTREVDVL